MDTLSRIEAVIAAAAEVLASGSLPTFRFMSRTAPTSEYRILENENDGMKDEDDERSIDTTLNNNHCVQPHSQPISTSSGNDDATVDRDLTSKNAVGAFQIARVFAVLDAVHDLKIHSRKCTQRDLYYRLLRPPVVSSMHDVTDAIFDVCCLLQVPRSALNICCSPKGAASGRLLIKSPHSDAWHDGTQTGVAGLAIPGDIDEIEAMHIHCDAHCVIVIEKDAIFQRLTDGRFFDIIPSVLVTGKGMPDLATRYFLQKLTLQFPHLLVFGLVDWNPSGVAILNVYKNGSHRMGPDVQQIYLPELYWLGVRCHMLHSTPHSCFQSLTVRDRSMIHSLQQHCSKEWRHELHVMSEIGLKCDIEALDASTGIDGFDRTIVEEMSNRIGSTFEIRP